MGRRSLMLAGLLTAGVLGSATSVAAVEVHLDPIVTVSEPSLGHASDGAIAGDGLDLFVVYRRAIDLHLPGGEIRLRRSTDGGASLLAPMTLSDPAASDVSFATVAAAGGTGHAAWVETTGDGVDQLRYRRSVDDGATWSDAVTVTPAAITHIRTARVFASQGRVFVVSVDDDTGRILIRRSSDDGLSFGAATTIGTTYATQPVSMAFGHQVVYVAWEVSSGYVRLRRSTTGGISWRPAMTMQRSPGEFWAGGPSVAAVGGSALLAVVTRTKGTQKIVTRGTRDRGSTWSPSRIALQGRDAYESVLEPVLHRAGSRWWIAYVRASNDGLFEVRLRASADGRAWSKARVVSDDTYFSFPAGLAATRTNARVWTAWYHDGPEWGGSPWTVETRAAY